MTKRTILLSLFFLPAQALSQSFATATQVVRLEVRSVSSIAISGNSAHLPLSPSEQGLSRLSVTDNSTRFKIVAGRKDVRLSFSLDRPMPDGARLLARVEGTKGFGGNTVDLSEAASSSLAVADTHRDRNADPRIVYTLESDDSHRTLSTQARTVTLTLTD